MSGISGIINLDGTPVIEEQLRSMALPMQHRGPDGNASWINGSAGLGHLQLHTTAESLGEILPLVDSQSSLVITADSRLDNRAELMAKLGLGPLSFALVSDSQLLLECYKRWGDDCATHLLGDFSFAIWDWRAQRLYVARDHFGKRPFYFYCSDSAFAFGSTALAVANAPRVPKLINQARVADFLVSGLEGINNTVSFVKNVYRLPPAHVGILENGRFRQHRYWQLDPEKEIRFNTDDEYVDGLEEVLTASVRANLRSHLPVAGMLSGGVDSSTICALATRLARSEKPGSFITISGTAENEDQCVETGYIQKMQASLATESVSLKPSDVEAYFQDLNRLVAIAEDPFDLRFTMHQMIYLTARAHKARVVLDGLDGDGVAGLSSMYPSCLLRSGQFAAALREIKGMRKHYYRVNYSIARLGLRAIRPALTPDFLRRWKQDYWVGSRFDPCIRHAHISAEFAQRTHLAQRVRESRAQSGVGFNSDLKRLHLERLEVAYLTAGIERYHRLAAIAGIEARSPLLDKRVVEFCLAMPWQLKWRNGWSKFALRSVLQRYVPAEIAWRSGWAEVGYNFLLQWQSHTALANKESWEQNKSIVKAESLLSQACIEKHRRERVNFTASDRIVNVTSLLNWIARSKLSWS